MDSFDLQIVLDKLAGLEMVLGLCLMGAGLSFMLMGFRIFKFVVSFTFGIIGFVIGWCLFATLLFQLISAIIFAWLLAVLSIFMYKTAVALLAGGWSGLVIILLISDFGLSDNVTMMIGGFVFIAVLSLTIIMYHEFIIYVTSLEGTLILLSGLVVFISHNHNIWRHTRQILLDTPILALFAVLCGTVTAYYLQISELSRKRSGTSG
ncbi:MAG: hypothetical protein ACYTF1_10270 [Planctomycetota bacterium]